MLTNATISPIRIPLPGGLSPDDVYRMWEWDNPHPGVYVGGWGLHYHVIEPVEWDWSLNRTPDEIAAIFRNGEHTTGLPTIPNEFGSVDSIEQFIERFVPELEADPRRFLVELAPITKKDNPGWRWHKNGPYLGDLTPRCEHIGDEPEIEEVVAYNLLLVTGNLGDFKYPCDREAYEGWLPL